MEQSNAHVDKRITMALSTLRNELLDLRSQDVKLMKQLLNINDTIQTMTNRQRGLKRHPKTRAGYQRRCISSCMLPVTSSSIDQRMPVRRLSASIFEDSMGSSSSLEGSIYSEDMSDFSESDEDLSSRSPKLSRPPSLSFFRDSDSDICDENLLRTNIRGNCHKPNSVFEQKRTSLELNTSTSICAAMCRWKGQAETRRRVQ